MADISGLGKRNVPVGHNNQIKRPWPVDISHVPIVGDTMKTNKTRTQKSVTFKTFAVFGVIVALIAGIFILRISDIRENTKEQIENIDKATIMAIQQRFATPAASEFNEGFVQVTLPEDTHVCYAEGINEGSIRLLDAWVTVVEKLIAFQERDGPELTPGDHELGYALTSMGTCGTFNQPYDVSILIEVEGYILFRFDPRLDFGTDTYITPSVSRE